MIIVYINKVYPIYLKFLCGQMIFSYCYCYCLLLCCYCRETLNLNFKCLNFGMLMCQMKFFVATVCFFATTVGKLAETGLNRWYSLCTVFV